MLWSEIRGEFERSKFCRLPSELLEFVEIFVLNERNIKAIEESPGCSYPKVKGMLKQVIEALGYEYKGKGGKKKRRYLICWKEER